MEKERKVEKKKLRKGMIQMIIVLSVIGAVIIFAIIFGVVPVLAVTPFGVFVNNTVGKFFNVANLFLNNGLALIETLVIIFFVWALNEIVKYVAALLINKFRAKSTLWIIVRSIIKYGSVIAGVFLVLSAWGVQTPTLLAGAGILGLALSFGAQSLIEDVIAGLFIIFEKQFQVGDIIQAHGFRGKVTEIGVRTTTLIDVNGDVLIINNSDLRQTINTSANLSPAICDIGIAYDEDIQRVEKIILNNIDDLKVRIPDIVEGPFYRGVQSLSDSSVVIRMYARTDELKKYQVTRDLNKEMKLLFDRNNIRIPFNQIVVHYEDGKEEKH
ncbi:MAG: mechanosensitive ion channel domain-containing protein [Bacilli bacterium]|jgi:small conductance mechanosensitive channel